MRILYGGGLNPENAAALFAKTDIDGVLVERCSLDVEEFVDICKEEN
jgi:triosephosphate isomerase